MPAASGVYKQVAIKEEVTRGTLPGASGAQLLRRTNVALNLTKDTYESEEQRSDLQVADVRHGVRRVAGPMNGELSPGSYSPYLGALLKRDFVAVTAMTAMSITIAAGAGVAWTVTRAAGSFLSSGLKVGHVVRLSAGSFNAANLNKNLFVVGVTALVATVIVLNGSALVAEGPIASATMSLPGKATFVPITGHTNKSFSVEEWYSDIAQSEVFTGVQFTKADIQMPPTGMTTIGFTTMGKDMVPGTSRYFTSPGALSSSGVIGSVNGALIVDGVRLASVTGLSVAVDAAYDGEPTIGTNYLEFVTPGSVRVSGQFTAYFESRDLADKFVNESKVQLLVAGATGNAAAADFVSFAMTAVKVNSSDKDDARGGQIRTYTYVALLDGAGGANLATEQTSILIQDSLAA